MRRVNARETLTSIATVMVSFGTAVGALLFVAQPASASPNPTQSYYVTTTDSSKWYAAGFLLGTFDKNRAGTQNRVVILDFGTPSLSGSTYGADPPGRVGFLSRPQMQPLATELARGYYVGTGSDTTSQLTLAVGVNNFGSQVRTNGVQQGRAWSNFVNQVRAGLAPGVSTQVTIKGAFDLETGWNGPTPTGDLVLGYGSINSNVYYDFGDAGGCPRSGTANCSNGWTVDQRWNLAWGVPYAFSIPEIYRDDGVQAEQWANLSRYGNNHHGSPIQFSGTLAQHQACIDIGDPCDGVNNTADDAWNQLLFWLATDANTAMSPRWSDDISWPFLQ